MRKFLLSLVAAAAALTSAPAAAQGHPAPPAQSRNGYHRDLLESVLKARLASVNARIDMLREQGAIGGEEAQQLRRQARRLEGRLFGLSRREAGDVELGIDRLESQVRFAADDARWGGHAYNRDVDDRDEDQDRYERGGYAADQRGDYEHFDRYTGSPVDRWHDPFDRGDAR